VRHTQLDKSKQKKARKWCIPEGAHYLLGSRREMQRKRVHRCLRIETILKYGQNVRHRRHVESEVGFVVGNRLDYALDVRYREVGCVLRNNSKKYLVNKERLV